MRKAHKKKICLVCSAGGHFEEIQQLKKVIDNYNHFFIITKNESTKKFNDSKYLVGDYNRRNFFTKVFSAIRLFTQELIIFIKERPNVIISTGAAVAIPIFKIACFFKRKTIYIESFARIYDLSDTGKKLLNSSDLFIVQWKQLSEKYKQTKFGGHIF